MKLDEILTRIELKIEAMETSPADNARLLAALCKTIEQRNYQIDGWKSQIKLCDMDYYEKLIIRNDNELAEILHPAESEGANE